MLTIIGKKISLFYVFCITTNTTQEGASRRVLPRTSFVSIEQSFTNVSIAKSHPLW